jgi:hypothetical protein
MITKALWKLLEHDLFLRRHPSFEALYDQIRGLPVAKRQPPADAIDRVKTAIDEACVWYPKRALCLQRSAVAVSLLRSLGVPAQFVYGVQQLPFKAHAWAEVEGQVINDRQEVQQEYWVMERI